MSVLVTGAAGFIGSHLCKRLIKDEYNVVGIDDLSAGNMFNLPDGMKFRRGDVTDKEDLRRLFRDHQFDTIFHLAASKKNICLDNPHRDLEVNGGGTLALLRIAKKKHVPRFIHISTGSVYGEAVHFPQAEDHPLNPVSFYGVSKLAGERYVRMFQQYDNFHTTILRLFHVYGPGQNDDESLGGVVAIFRRLIRENQPVWIFGTGDQQRSFTYVEDVVEVCIRSMTNQITHNKVYNVASGFNYTIRQLADLLGAKRIKHGERLEGDIDVFDIDNSLVRRDLGVCFRSLEEGLMKW